MLGWPAHEISIHPFGLMVVCAIWVGVGLTQIHARRVELPTAVLWSYMVWLIASGFIGGHVFDLLLYYPVEFGTAGAWLRVSEGQSSFGGFLGAACGSWLWSKWNRCPAWPFADVVASALPSAWVVGRLGCAIAHDHPGRASTAWWAVAYPGSPRLDMGLLEAAATLPLAIALLWLRRRPRPRGFFVGAVCVYYAPIRFTLDFSRATDIAGADQRYLGLTPAQWGCIGLLAVGVCALTGAIARSSPKREAVG
jgi:phosphatidylglycerol:prolipoprotein diacylglycerol transferase